MSTSASASNKGDDHVGFAAFVLPECSHCPQVGKLPDGVDHNTPCTDCGNQGENMMCLTCFQVHCGRHVNAHMLEHYEKTTHPMVLGFADLSIWCYPCENYVDPKNVHVAAVARPIYIAKFGEEPPAAASLRVIGGGGGDKKAEQEEEKKTEGDEKDEAAAKIQRAFKKSSEKETTRKLFSSFDAHGVIDYIVKHDCKNILVMTGAGISVAAGIPDFRTPGTGLYSNLAKYNLPTPEAVFTLDYLKKNPEVFFKVSKDMQLWPGSFAPTHVHHFIYQLQEQGRLLRAYTQNIDCLERSAGIKPDLLVEAHGTFSAAHCIEAECKAEADLVAIRATMDKGEIPRCQTCNGIVKPDVVFFGEGLPARFSQLLKEDHKIADLVIVIGTSLKVQPFASVAYVVKEDCPRILINNNLVGNFKLHPSNVKTTSADEIDDRDTKAGAEEAEEVEGTLYRDIFLNGDCQAVVQELALGLGFQDKLQERYDEMQRQVSESKKK